MGHYDSNYEVPPLSRKEIRAYAKQVRNIFGITTIKLPVVNLLEALHTFGIDEDIIDDETWERDFGVGKHAEFNLTDGIISIKQSVYDRAVAGCGRDRFTITHEVAHAILLDAHEIKVCRTTGEVEMKTFCNPEWQADCFAGELLVPYDICKYMSVNEIVRECNVSKQAAEYQKSKF